MIWKNNLTIESAKEFSLSELNVFEYELKLQLLYLENKETLLKENRIIIERYKNNLNVIGELIAQKSKQQVK